MAPLSPERYALQVTISSSTREKLAHARNLMSHAVPSGDIATILDRALDALVEKLEKRKCGATKAPRRSARKANAPRTIPAHVKRDVWQRDGGRCTFVGPDGRRCESRGFLEFDHVVPVAKRGAATPGNIRLRCRAHNLYEAEQVYGAGFMHGRRTRAVPVRGAPR